MRDRRCVARVEMLLWGSSRFLGHPVLHVVVHDGRLVPGLCDAVLGSGHRSHVRLAAPGERKRTRIAGEKWEREKEREFRN